MDYKYVCSLIDKVWLNTEDIQKLCNCSRKSAMDIRREVEDKIKESGKRLPTAKCQVVPTMILLDYLGIDVNTVLNVSTKGKGIITAIR